MPSTYRPIVIPLSNNNVNKSKINDNNDFHPAEVEIPG